MGVISGQLSVSAMFAVSEASKLHQAQQSAAPLCGEVPAV